MKTVHLGLVALFSARLAAQVACVPFPAGFVPFAGIRYTTAPVANGDRLVVGALPQPNGLQAVNSTVPLPGAPNQSFCGPVQLGPGNTFEPVYVPTASERVGDFSAFNGLLRDPETDLPFPAGIIPISRLGTVYAWRIGAAPWPAISAGGIVNAAGDRTAPISSPGSLISIYGSRLAARSEAAGLDEARRLPLTLGGAEVKIGDRPAPLLFVSSGQINAQVPYELVPGSYPVTITTAEGTSAAATLAIGAASPGIFAVVKLPDFSIVSAANPARANDVLVIYLTGLGAVTPAVTTGQAAPSTPLSSTTERPRVTVDGEPLDIANSVLSPGFVGLYQVGFALPAEVPGGRYPLVVRQAGIRSSPVDLVVAGSGSPGVSGCELVLRGDRRLIFRPQIPAGLNVDFVYLLKGSQRYDLAIGALIDSGRCEMYGLDPFGFSDDFTLFFDLSRHPDGPKRRIQLRFPANLPTRADGEFSFSGGTGLAHGLIVLPGGCRTPAEKTMVPGVGWFFTVCID